MYFRDEKILSDFNNPFSKVSDKVNRYFSRKVTIFPYSHLTYLKIYITYAHPQDYSAFSALILSPLSKYWQN